MEKKEPLITKEEYKTICKVFDKLNVDLTTKGDVVSECCVNSYASLFRYLPTISMILGKYAESHPSREVLIEDFINQLSQVSETLAYITADHRTYFDVDKFLCEIEKMSAELDEQ